MARPAGDRRRVLVIEDDALLAAELQDILEDAGYEVIGPAYAYATGLGLARTERPDAALIDIEIAGGRGDEIAEYLFLRGTPFIFVSGHPRSALALQNQTFPYLRKPFAEKALLNLLEASMDR